MSTEEEFSSSSVFFGYQQEDAFEDVFLQYFVVKGFWEALVQKKAFELFLETCNDSLKLNNACDLAC